MVSRTHLGIIVEEEHRQPSAANRAPHKTMRDAAVELARGLDWLPGASSETFPERCKKLSASFKALAESLPAASAQSPGSEGLLWLRDNTQQLSAAVRAVSADIGRLTRIPHVSRKEEIVPRVLAIAEGYLAETNNEFREDDFMAFCLAFEEVMPVEFNEIGTLVPALKLGLLEQIVEQGKYLVSHPADKTATRIPTCIRSLQNATQTSWEEILERLVPFDKVLREDPTGAYAAMDVESRNLYRAKISRFAERSDRSEMEIAQEALALARQAYTRDKRDARTRLRESHIGYYLIAEGSEILGQRVGFHPTFGERFRTGLRRHPDEFLLLGIALLTLAVMTAAVWLLTPATTSPLLIILSMLFLLLPSSQAAVQVMNYLATNLLPAGTLPKLEFSKEVPDDCVTLVAIPALLLNEKQVHTLVEDLEVRYLGNHHRNIHFALVSDLPDSPEPAREDNALVELCSRLIGDLNERYAAKNSGTFFLFHRHRVYNPRERGWMGWERKRGKLHDLNQYLRGRYDSFPVKVGNLSLLSNVRFVITLDSDTELPRGSAHRMAGTMAHPLNQAIIDPAKNIVAAGYGILQPRVAISVQCTARSRLATIFAGETGLDPYTRAISDVYQDLYGEGTYAGKGIYEVDAMLQVLEHRFPRNALLSHDLIEGAYARVGLATDILVIEDYPTHYSAYNRRKHRWLRGDWQIVEWLTDHVPNESGARVSNPISLVSRWKILDNLRRSLVEPATFALFLFGWLAMGRPLLWTLVTICILFCPAWFEFAFILTRAAIARQMRVAREALNNVLTANLAVLLTLTLLAHQMLLSLDAVVRALVRHLVTREHMLEWETAAEAEIGERRTAFDRYIDWMPVLAIGLGTLIWLVRPQALLSAAPILVLWACSQRLAVWLNESPMEPAPPISDKEAWLLRKSALYIWRYFAEFSTEEHNWLIPDNVQEEPSRIAGRISPTNVGLLLNARQVANELGYLTLPEMVELTRNSLDTIARLSKYRGHLLNWYDTRTLEAKAPFFVSSVDSGNLVASLWTLQQGCVEQRMRPLISRELANGLLDHLKILNELGALRKRGMVLCESEVSGDNWLDSLLTFPAEILDGSDGSSVRSAEIDWFRTHAHTRLQSIQQVVRSYVPWMLPEFAAVRHELAEGMNSNGIYSHLTAVDTIPLQELPGLIAELETRVAEVLLHARNGHAGSAGRLSSLLQAAKKNVLDLIEKLRQLSRESGGFAEEMDFSFLLDKQRLLLSVGLDAQSAKLQPYCYDLLATEPRTAVFVAIAKEDIPQDCWFRLGRPYGFDHGRPVLLSWTGTMFEYLMPSLWLRSYRNTLLDRANIGAVQSQQAYAGGKGIPWGISESSSSERNEEGEYHYEAFGVPSLALKKNEVAPLVISPYSTFLALSVDPQGALRNLQRMNTLGWFGPYGFYEAADYRDSGGRFLRNRCMVVRSWMAHHQGMSLLSLGNFLRDSVVQRWFRSDRRVMATELLLQEKPVSQPV
ncbi:MAG: glucoamylase family protein [Terriglobales bacterium]